MKKAQLKTGMKVVLRNGIEYIIMLGQQKEIYSFIQIGKNYYVSLNSYNDDLTSVIDKELDVMFCYFPSASSISYLFTSLKKVDWVITYSRKDN